MSRVTGDDPLACDPWFNRDWSFHPCFSDCRSLTCMHFACRSFSLSSLSYVHSHSVCRSGSSASSAYMSRHIQKEWRGRQAGLRVRETERRSEDCSFSLRDGEGGERERKREGLADSPLCPAYVETEMEIRVPFHFRCLWHERTHYTL